MRRKLTIGEARWPETQEFAAVATCWRQNASIVMLGFVWKGYDLLCSEILSKVDITLADEQLERSVTLYLTPRIRRHMSGYEPFHVEHEVDELETRFSPEAKPPCYDIAFILTVNERIMWPLEAKILRTDGAVGPYTKEITGNFLTCRYAPFSGEGAILGYLIAGDPANVFKNIEIKTPCYLDDHLDFGSHAHKTSEHVRSVPAGKLYPINFRCHHLIMPLTP